MPLKYARRLLKLQKFYTCLVCGGDGQQRHHLIPVSRHGSPFCSAYDPKFLRRTVNVCFKCHRDIHEHFNNLELAEKFASADALKAELIKRKQLITDN